MDMSEAEVFALSDQGQQLGHRVGVAIIITVSAWLLAI